MKASIISRFRHIVPMCWLLGHRHSRKAAQRHGYSLHSRCLHCRKPMIQAPDGDWIIN